MYDIYCYVCLFFPTGDDMFLWSSGLLCQSLHLLDNRQHFTINVSFAQPQCQYNHDFRLLSQADGTGHNTAPGKYMLCNEHMIVILLRVQYKLIIMRDPEKLHMADTVI